MDELNAEGFSAFFQELWGHAPFAWQTALARQVLTTGRWPQAVALPTAAGKTACMDIAVYALAASPLPAAPRRIFFVVDRRVIVDEAFERARSLAHRLREARGGLLERVADRLRQISGGSLPLAVYALRGGMARSDAWARSPVQPMIVASTVDQIGSRLLFRAYGVGAGSRPIHAGLTGNDSLILLDEAHCAQPFLETLQGVARCRQWAQSPLPASFQVSVMSATPPAGITEIFRDESGEPRDPAHPLGQRQLAAKPARLVVADKVKGKDAEVQREALVTKLVEAAQALVREWPGCDRQHPDGGHPAVVIFCNRVDTARRVHARLGESALLLTGRMRPLDKDDTLEHELAEFSVDRARQRRLDAPRFVVATQTLEVGANLDFDLLVSECASLDALRQRFGRLNRLGRDIAARAAIVAAADLPEDDPVYGAGLRSTWNWLQQQAGKAGTVDFGIAALAERLPESEALAELNAPARHAPVLLPAHVDALAQTAPEPWPSPEVALFLHGPDSGPADVTVCWRGDLVGDAVAWSDLLRLCPPVALECVAVPFLQMRRWLAGKIVPAGADVEGEGGDEPADEAPKGPPRLVVRWRGVREVGLLEAPEALRPGDVLVIPASVGGWEELATLGAAPLADLGDRAQVQLRGRVRLRLHPELIAQWPDNDARAVLLERVQSGQAADEPEALAEDLHAALSDYAATDFPPCWAWLKEALAALPRASRLARHISPHPTGGLVLTLYLAASEEAFAFSDEDDESSSGNFRSLLPEHLCGVADYAARHARLCGLPDTLIGIFHDAGLGHDLGKADPRFQAWLKGGNPWIGGPLLAKAETMKQTREESRKARIRAGYPEGGRHELLSVRLLESLPQALPTNPDLRDLLLHLVESHHGHCRPFAPVVVDESPRVVEWEVERKSYRAHTATGLERLDAGPAERYWRLTHLYGWWGLAWLETLLRLADHRRSAWEERNVQENET